MKKIYNIRGTRWYQDELTYDEDGRARVVLRQIEQSFSDAEKKFETILDQIQEKNLIPDLFKIILKPYQPTLLHAIRNMLWAKYHNIDMASIAGIMTKSQIAVVLKDFFFYSTNWTQILSDTESSSTMSQILPEKLRTRMPG